MQACPAAFAGAMLSASSEAPTPSWRQLSPLPMTPPLCSIPVERAMRSRRRIARRRKPLVSSPHVQSGYPPRRRRNKLACKDRALISLGPRLRLASCINARLPSSQPHQITRVTRINLRPTFLFPMTQTLFSVLPASYPMISLFRHVPAWTIRSSPFTGRAAYICDAEAFDTCLPQRSQRFQNGKTR